MILSSQASRSSLNQSSAVRVSIVRVTLQKFSYTKAFYMRLLFYHLSALMLAHRHFIDLTSPVFSVGSMTVSLQ